MIYIYYVNLTTFFQIQINLQSLINIIEMSLKSKVDPESIIDQKRMWGLYKEKLRIWEKFSVSFILYCYEISIFRHNGFI